MTKRLIEEWLPIAALGEESVRERRSMTALPPNYYLHVWWARRPLVASRAAVLACVLPASTNHDEFLRAVGILGDPVAVRARIDRARRTGEDLGPDVYGYPRAFLHSLSRTEREWVSAKASEVTGQSCPRVLDPTAGGGAIPFETMRLGFHAIANDLNPVAALILRQTLDAPARFGEAVLARFRDLRTQFLQRCEAALSDLFPAEENGATVDGYIWARTIRCPYCDGTIPLSPNWRLSANGTGIRLVPDLPTRSCATRVVTTAAEQSPATIADGEARCPFSDCERVVDGDEVKAQAQSGRMGDQLIAVATKASILVAGSKKPKYKQTRVYRPPLGTDLHDWAASEAEQAEWQAFDLCPAERIPDGSKTAEAIRYGFARWMDLFSPRQLRSHVACVRVFRSLLDESRGSGRHDNVTASAFAYLALSLDKYRDYNSRMTRWHSGREVIVNTFDRHDFAMKWTYAEMAPCGPGRGLHWVTEQTEKCIRELVSLVRPEREARDGTLSLFAAPTANPTLDLMNVSGDALVGVPDGSVDVIVMDPPYGANVMYAELSDFFYVWLKRTAGHVYPELFRRNLTDKDAEAVANVGRYPHERGAGELANRDYQDRMAAIFAECRRVLRPGGIMTVMFTHKATYAWDALTSGLLEAGFAVTASWPVNTEAEGSLHIQNKAAANSTIFLVCRPRVVAPESDNPAYWEDVEPQIASRVRSKIAEFEKGGIRGVDLYLSCFGPALEVLATHWPLKRGQPRDSAKAPGRRKKRGVVLSDPYSVSPEDALDAARREVKRWKLDKLLRTSRHADMDPMTEWFVLAWDAFKAPEFPYDEGLRLARVVGVDFDGDIIGKLAEKKAGSVVLWDSGKRAAKGALGPSDGSRAVIDALHHAAHRVRTVGLEAGRELLATSKADQSPSFLAALTAVLEVLPVSKTFTKLGEEAGTVAEAASDFDALEHLRRLAYSDRVPMPEQLGLWT